MVEMVKANLNGLDELIIPKHRADRDAWYTEKGWEKQRHKSMKEHIGEGDVVYYVGAEEGEFPALCSKWGADVVMFEPNPLVWSNIKAIWDANKLKKPLAFYAGFASNKTTHQIDKTVTFEDIATKEVIGNHGFKELYLEADNYPQIQIDTVVNAKYKPPTVITMDVEGSEYQVLLGAEETIKKFKPKIWLSLHAEFVFYQWGMYSREIRDWIIDKGYEETFLEWEHEAHFLYLPK